MLKSVLYIVFVTTGLAGTTAIPLNSTAKQCRLPSHPSVEYNCIDRSIKRTCNELEPDGTVVTPSCKSPIYYSPTPLLQMRCLSGSWDYIATCIPECGRVSSQGVQLSIDANNAGGVETRAPWHVGIYSKNYKPYRQICGGTLVSTNVVISAAHCFWDHTKNAAAPASKYAVASGKLHRHWDNPIDNQAQKSDIRTISIPARFFGAAANYQDDISVLTLTSPIRYTTAVRPICLDFDFNFERYQLRTGNNGKIASWTDAFHDSFNQSAVLKVHDLPYVDIEQCIQEIPVTFREHITSDKICAYGNDTSQKMCRGGAGGGLVFPATEKAVIRFYLRGVLSTAAIDHTDDMSCSKYLAFTQILKHEHFIKQKLSLAEGELA